MTFTAMKFRVESPEHSEKIQKKLFEMGYAWNGGISGLLDRAGALYARTNGTIGYDVFDLDEEFFNCWEGREYTLKEIISYELVQVKTDPVLPPVELIELNGLKYKKSELEEALKLIKPMEEN